MNLRNPPPWQVLTVILLVLGLSIWGSETWLRPMLDPGAGDRVLLEMPEGCELNRAGCTVGLDGMRLTLRGPDTIPPLEDFDLILEAQGPVEPLEVSYIMPGMDMGVNRFAFGAGDEGIWHAPSALPVCMSGRLDWLAQVRFAYEGREYEVRVPVLLSRPARGTQD
ncbi:MULTISPECIES: hypothetical protein [unclassified Ectothiorhodospira]|uniref:hypothetical protein n=1 Tax=unclassified Ectothiorhodospira TaxID=2684909 RepID=UPI001EE7BA2C|nr:MULTISPECIES: hypothetical protein [unclassified Ectothiorhodospira]MCG5515065.1 hypothetical protein [Ectothiorhodospira sp. 9100]MCG5517783.1 hypothetical protein [Ectothiorhodospira sp. 9905]